MKNADFISAASRLEDALKQLEHVWAETREDWSDGVSRRLEDDYLMPLKAQVRAMTDTVEKLSGVLRQAESACLHPREKHQSL
ncbi:MAG: hypothetical protein Fues2KO_23300 [Fuerstiella sp.]